MRPARVECPSTVYAGKYSYSLLEKREYTNKHCWLTFSACSCPFTIDHAMTIVIKLKT